MSQVHLSEDQSAVVAQALEFVEVRGADGSLLGRLQPHPADWVDRWMEWHDERV